MGILVLGLGNAVMTDDAFGVQAVSALQSGFDFPAGVDIVDGGTLGLDLLPLLEGISRLLILDALEMAASPGTIFRLEGEEVPRAFAHKLSVHQMGVQDLLALAELRGHLPDDLVVLGVQPGSIGMGTELTPAVAAAIPDVVARVVQELARWGVKPSRALPG